MSGFRAYRLFLGQQEQPEGRLVNVDLDDLSAGDVVIRVAYSSVNYKDALVSKGANRIVREYPRISGIDLTGTVEESSDPRVAIGDAVIVHGFGIGVDHDGGHAEYARIPGDWVLPLPSGLSLREAAAIGVAGYTAALSIHLMELNGLRPDSGKVAVTGATGGAGSIAIDMLCGAGYSVSAITGKMAERDYLVALGADEVIDRASLEFGSKPLEKSRWAGAIDSVGGQMLGWLTRTMQTYGVIASFGNVGGMELSTTVLPFILRGVRLIGIIANSPMPLRREVWGRISRELKPRHLDAITQEIGLDDLPQAFNSLLSGQSTGRFLLVL